MKLKDQINNLDHHTFQAPSDLVLPNAIGKY